MVNLERLLKKQKIHFGCKCRIYPTDEQIGNFKRQFGCCRFIYNYLLIRMEKAYKRRQESISIYEAKKFISALKKTSRYSFLKEVNSQSLQASALNLGKARQKFFAKEGGYPNLKNKVGRQSCEVPQNFLLIKSKRGNDFLTIPKLKSAIKIKLHREVRGKVRNIAISKEPDGKHYASLSCLREEYCVTVFDSSKDGDGRGYDLGLIDLYVTEEGERVKVLRPLNKAEVKLARAQKEQARKKKGGANREKARLKVAKIHTKVKNQRKDAIHKQSYKIVDENQVIYLETLNIKGMMKNHCLSKAFADAMLGEFIRQCKYKAKWRNKQIIQIGRFEPSSKLCSNCGVKNNELKLHHRIWNCKTCHASHDRDINAAINIKKIGQGMPEFTPAERSTAECRLARWQPSWLAEAGSGF